MRISEKEPTEPGSSINGSARHIHRIFLILLIAVLLPGCGYLSGAHSSVEPPASVRNHKIVRTAYAQLGKKYRSGAASPQKGFDCSGLVWWSYGQHGIKVPRITTDQANAGRKVSKKAARPGDIVVFRTGQSPRGLHTGIYCGDQKFIHAPSSGKRVCIESLTLPHWRDTLIAVRRVSK